MRAASQKLRRIVNDDRERPPAVTNLSVAALGALFLANVALGILGLILIIVGARGGGGRIRDAFAHGGLDSTLFENPGDSAQVIGALLCALAAYGFVALWTRNKTHLLCYHGLALFVLVGLIFACSVMNIYKEGSGAMVQNYMMQFRQNPNITETRHVGRPIRADGMDRAQWFRAVSEAKLRARLFLRTVISCMAAAIFFDIVSLACSAYIMGLKYTGVRIGYVTGVAGIVFGMTLFVLCYFVARSTYNVPDAVSMKFDVQFVHDPAVYEPPNAVKLFNTLRAAPELIFETIDDAAGGGRRRLLEDTNSTSPPPDQPSPPAQAITPSPPPPGDWRAQSVWVFEERHIVVDNTHYNLTFKLALAGISGDTVNDESFSAWCAQKVADFANITNTGDIHVSEFIAGAEHKIGGLWAPRFLAAAAFIIVFVNFLGIFAIYRDDRFLLASHFCMSFTGVLLLIIAAALIGKYADATSKLISNNWHSIQNKVIGAGVEPTEAGSFARAHFKAAAALAGTVIVLQLASMMSTLFAFFSDEPSYTLLSPGASRSNGAMSGRGFSAMELDGYDEEYGKSTFSTPARAHARRGSDGLVNLSTPTQQKHFSID